MSNGTIATHTLAFVSVDPSRGMSGMGVCIIPLDVPGVSKGAPLNKLGQRALNQGEIFFDGVRIPRYYMLIDPTAANALIWVWAATAVWIILRATFGVLRIWPGIGDAPLQKEVPGPSLSEAAGPGT